MMQTIVIGHKNPDMDSICSALAYAHLKRATGMENVVAGRAGTTNARVDFVLSKFGVESPVFFSDVSPKVRDVMECNVISVRQDAAVARAIGSIEQKRLRGLPVLDHSNRFLGLLSSTKVSHHLFPSLDQVGNARKVRTCFRGIVECFDGKVITGSPDEEVRDHLLMVAAMSLETLESRLKRYDPAEVVLIVGDRTDIHQLAIRAGVKSIVITGGMEASPEVIEQANASGTALVQSLHDTATTVMYARGAMLVSEMLEPKFDSFHPETSLDLARNKAAESKSVVFPIIDEEGCLVGILSKSDFLKKIPRQLILVDHNELGQAVNGASRLPIVEILDHHRLSVFSTEVPILFWNNPVGSTSTIITLCYEQNQVEIPVEIAGLLMAGLISDTLNLTSPTATDTDRRLLKRLSAITGINPADLASEIFAVGSPLLTLSSDDAIHSDCKDYEEDGVAFTIAQIEELSLVHFDQHQARLLEALESHRSKGKFVFAALLVTDINTQESLMLMTGHDAILRTIDYPQLHPNVWALSGIVSRKKQLLPYLLQCLQKVDKNELTK